MSLFKYFSNLREIKDKLNPFSRCFIKDNGNIFYIEPMFNTQFELILLHHPNSVDTIVNEINRVSDQYPIVIFAGDEENLITKKEGAVELTIYDLLDKLGIFVEDKSRGSDYGD